MTQDPIDDESILVQENLAVQQQANASTYFDQGQWNFMVFRPQQMCDIGSPPLNHAWTGDNDILHVVMCYSNVLT